jgi:putative tricarboxylic transport membrane protein
MRERLTKKKKNGDVWSSLFLMVLAGFVIREALELEIGTPTNPGSGFMIFGVAVALGLLALYQCAKAFAALTGASESATERIRWGRILATISAIVFYILALRSVGYLVCTFLLLSFLFQVLERGHWATRTIGAATTSFATYFIFAKMLQLNLPRGLITFY